MDRLIVPLVRLVEWYIDTVKRFLRVAYFFIN
jgi:hypothetical protein